MIYLDSNVFIYATLNNERIGDAARLLLRRVQSGEVKAASSTLSFDELVWIVKKNRTFEDAIASGEAFLNMPALKLVEVDEELLAGALLVMKKYGLDPRDSIHAASAMQEMADTIISTDRDFDRMKEIKRQELVED